MGNDEKKYYRTVVQVEVLSEEPISDELAHNLEALAHEITEGDCSGLVDVVEREEVDGKRMAELLQAQGSDPEFFELES